MERVSFVKYGALRLPPGFRFHPTDEELVLQYLKRKVFSFPLPASIIPEVDVCKSDPWDLPGVAEQEKYFFSTKEVKYPNGNRSNRATGSGYWKATGIDKRVVTSRNNQPVGMKKTLVFYRGKPPHGTRTDWVMHEYRLLSSDKKNPIQACAGQMEKWVLCRIFLKKRRAKDDDEGNPSFVHQKVKKQRAIMPVFYDFMKKEPTDLNFASSCSFSGSSGITDISCGESNDHEESSSCNSLS